MSATHSGPQIRFLCDQTLGKLARWLRILGFDTEYLKHDDDERIRHAIASGRIVLTRRTTMAGTPSVHVIAHDRVREQLIELGRTYDLEQGAYPFSRCSLCNARLEGVGRDEVKGLVPDYVHATLNSFARCPSCNHIYWKGTHYDRTCDKIRNILKVCSQ